MKALLRYFIYYFIFWLVVFLINRFIFLLSVIPFLQVVSVTHAMRSLFSGWRLDLSTVGYLLAIPGLLIILYYLFQKKWIEIINRIAVSLFIVIYCLASFGELCLYQEWTTKLNMQALLHFRHPAEVFQSATLKLTLLFFGLSVFFSWIYIRFYFSQMSLKKLLYAENTPTRKQVLISLAYILFFIPLDFVILRGGLSAIPISDSDAYYSKSHVLNDVAVNPLWGLGHNILEYTSHQEENPYVFMPETESKRLMEELFSVEKDTTVYFLSSGKPNIVILILEGFSAYTLPNFGGDSFAPFLDSLSKQGISFTRCYAAAYASDQGIPAILSAYPSAPRVAITNQSSKSLKLPCINKDLKPLGYESGFIFGGQLNYGNIKSYLYNMQFDVVKERKDFPLTLSGGHLGIHDGDMAPLAVEELNRAKQPFVYAWFTVSSHSPYDIPEKIVPVVEHRQNPYINCIIYSDKALRLFFEKAKVQPWYPNTLFVIVSDHSHFTNHDFDIEDKEYHRIVSFMYGEPVKAEFRGAKVQAVSSQLDMIPTLLKQLHLETDHYYFGKNLMNPLTAHFAYYDYHHGTGFVTDSCFISKAKEVNELAKNSCGDSASTNQIKKTHDAFLQEAFRDYLER